jgi:fumarylacetoacetase
MALGPAGSGALRAALSRALRADSALAASLRPLLLPQAAAEYRVAAAVGDFTDFYTSIYHASAVGRLLRPDNPLLPNYKWVPIAYHARASSVCISGHAFPRPRGQLMPPGARQPELGATRRLDYELEVGVFIGRGNPLGSSIALGDAEQHVFGLCLLNDWSARDVQAWEYQPLGPFLGKNFATTVSPWVVTLEALAPFRAPWVRPADEPAPLAYLDHADIRAAGAIDLQLEVWLETQRMRERGDPPARLSQSNYRDAYWTLAQLIAHHTVNGCNLESGDLLGTGTLSGPEPRQGGSLLELSMGGRQPITLPDGESRAFVADGDTIILTAFCRREGFRRIGFGECRATLTAAAVPH